MSGGARYKAVWALVRICGSTQFGRYLFISVCVHWHGASWSSGVSVSRAGVVNRRRLCMIGYIYGVVSVVSWWVC